MSYLWNDFCYLLTECTEMGTMKIKARIVIFITLMFLIMIAIAAYGAPALWVQNTILALLEKKYAYSATRLIFQIQL